MSNTNHDALYEGAAFGLIENRTLIEVRGNDRYTFLHNLCTNDIKSLTPGSGCEAFFTNVQGKTLCHALLFCMEDAIWISTDPNLAEQLLPHLDKYLIREDVELIDKTSDIRTYLVAGPQSAALTEQTLGVCPSEPLAHTSSTVSPNVVVSKVPIGFFIHANGEEKVSELFAANGVQLANADTIELARIESCFPSSGRDVTLENLPQEIDRDELAISFTKGCYLGQETVARIDALGKVNKKLVLLQFEGSETPEVGTEISLDDKVVGKVTSSCWSPKSHAPIGLGFVRRQEIESGATLSCKFGAVSTKSHAESQRRKEET